MKRFIVFVLLLFVLLLPFASVAFASGNAVEAAPVVLTAEQLGAFAGILLSLLFAYVPRFKTWYNAKEGEVQALIMLAFLVLTTLVIFGLSCLSAPILPFAVTCTQQGAWELLSVFISALVANQSTFLVAVKPFKPEKESLVPMPLRL